MMAKWQVSCKHEAGDDMDLMVFRSLWRVLRWLMGNLKKYRIIVIVRIEE